MMQNLTAVRTIATTMPFMMLVLNAGVVAALWLGGMQVNDGTLQVGQIVAFINYLMQTLMSMMMVSMLVMRVSRAEASAVRVLEVFESEPKVKASPAPVADFALKGRVAFEQVRFSYSDDRASPVLKGSGARRDGGFVGGDGVGQVQFEQFDSSFARLTRRLCGGRLVWRCRSPCCLAARFGTIFDTAVWRPLMRK